MFQIIFPSASPLVVLVVILCGVHIGSHKKESVHLVMEGERFLEYIADLAEEEK
jgi:hypothetical protein